MKKRWIVLLLTVALVLGLAVFTMAAGEETQRVLGPNGEMYHCECGALWFDGNGNPTETGTCMDGCSGENLTWIPLSEPVVDNSGDILPKSGNYYLTNDITVTYPTYMNEEIRFDLNGHSITREKNKLIQVEAGGSLVITDTSKNANGRIATHSVQNADQYGVVVSVLGGGSAKLLKGTLDASKASHASLTGGAVCVKGTGSGFVMYGGTILGGTAYQGGAVHITDADSTFELHGGTISGGTASEKGGAIYSKGTLTISGGIITGGTAAGGGNICQSGGTLTMTGGVVENGTMTSTHGGNIRVDTSAVVNLYGGVICNGKVKESLTSNGFGANLAIVTATVTVGGKDTAMIIEGGNARDAAAIYHHAGTLTIGSNAVINSGTVTAGSAECVLINTGVSVALTGKPQIAEVYLKGTAKVNPTGMDVNARIGLDSNATGGIQVSSATVDAVTAGCFYSTNTKYFFAHSGTSYIYVYPSTTAGSCICGADNRGTEHTKGCYYILDSQWAEVSDADSIVEPASGRKVYKLTSDVTLSSELSWSAGHMVIDLNGCKLTADYKRMFTLSGSASLTITDTSVDKTGQIIYSRTDGSDGGIMNLAATTKLYVFGGTIDASGASIGYGAIARLGNGNARAYIHGGSILGGKTTGSGGGAFSCVGTIYMTGGSITGGTHNGSGYGGGAIHLGGGSLYMSGNAKVIGSTTNYYGGAVLVRNGGTLSMTENASITGGSAAKNGGAVSTYDGQTATVLISGNASITGGEATSGGAVYFGSNCTMTMSGGTITGGTAGYGGAIYMSGSGAQFTLNGGTIEAGDNVTTCGGAVYVGSGATFTMNDGDITAAGKTAPYGTGVCAYGGTFNMYNGTLTGGTATTSGGGALYVASSGAANMYGGTITGGTYTGTSGGGGNIRVSSGCTMTMSGGTISAGKATRGGNVIVYGTFTMDGGTITGGEVKNPTSSIQHGGNIHVREGGSFTMNGGTVSNGNAGTSNGGNIAMISANTKVTINGGTITGGTAASGSSVWVHSGTTTGNVTVSGEPTINSIYLMTGKTITIGTDGLGDKARIGVVMQTPGVFTAENATSYATRFVPPSNDYYVVHNANKLELVLIDEYTGEVVAIVGSTPFDTIQDAVDAVSDSKNQYVKLMASATEDLNIGKDLYLDLNGNTITGDISNDGFILYLFDTATEDYYVADGYGMIKGNVSGEVAPDFVAPAAFSSRSKPEPARYILILDENGYYSSHKLYIRVKSVVLNPTTTAIDYKITLLCDEVLAKHITAFGLRVWATDGNGTYSEPRSASIGKAVQAYGVPYGTGTGNENIYKVRVANILQSTLKKTYENEEARLADQQMRAEQTKFETCAYIKLDSANGDKEITSSRTKAMSLKEVVTDAEGRIDESITLNTNQKWALKQMYNAYTTLMEPWFEGIDNPVIPSMVTVAADYKVHCICGDENSTNNPCARAGHPDQAWEPWDGASDITAAGNYYLTQDLDAESGYYQKNMGSLGETNQPCTINLDLNGHSITSGGRVFGVGTNITFNLVNSEDTGGIITGKNAGNTALGGVIFAQTGSTIGLYPNVTVDGSAANVQLGGAIYTSGALNIYGATVTGADLDDVTGSFGGAIYLTGTEEAPASMTMNSGTVTGGNVAVGGGAVLVNSYATLTLNGGDITAEGMTAQYGAAIRLESSSTLNVKGGTITGGTATGSGGGAISSAGTISMTGGTVQNGKFTGTDQGGGNIRIGDGAKMTMTGGTISGGESSYRGGNVYVLGEFEMSGGEIVNGKTDGTYGHGGNVHVRDGASFTMTDGTISGGQVLGENSDGGNIAVINGTGNSKVAINGGTISGGSSTRTGPSVWLHTGTLSVSGAPEINDIYLPADQYITIGGDLSSGASIGVTLVDGEGRFTTADNATAANAAYFHSADGSLPYVCVGDEGLQLSAVNVYSVGYGAASIDPDLSDGNSYLLLGYSNQDRIATAIDDSDGDASNGYDLGLLATCLAVTDAQGDTILLISVDAASMGSVSQTVKNQIAKATGVPVENIMISAAHQHSTPDFTAHYLNTYFYPGIVKAAQAAMADRAEVKGINTSTVATTDANGKPQFGFIRNITLYEKGEPRGTWSPNHDDRVYPYGKIENGVYKNYQYYSATIDSYYGDNVSYTICNPDNIPSSGYAMCYETVIDSDLQLVKFKRDTGDIIMANFQVHPHLSSNANTTVISADVVGAFRNALATKTNGAKVMYFSGASGNINPINYIGDTVYEKTAGEGENIGTAHINYGNALAQLANDATYDAVEIVDDVSVASADLSYAIKKDSLRQDYSGVDMDGDSDVDSQDLYLVSKAIVDAGSITGDQKTTWGFYGFFDAKYTYLRMQEYLNDEGVIDMENMKPVKSLTISAYSLGDIAFVAAPYEMFCENGQQIKNGYEGLSNPYSMTFVATQANGNNGYIPSAAGYTNGGYSTDVTRFAEGTGEELVKEYLALLDSLN